jgi:predicted alpha/beta hydrolase
MKISAALETQTPKIMRMYATLCGMTLARAHAKAGDAAMIAGYLGNNDHVDQAIGKYAVAYADQAERDFATFAQAVKNGQLKSDLSASELTTALR